MPRTISNSALLRLLLALGASSATNYASALAFAAFLSVFPLLLGLLAVLGFLVHSPAIESQLLTLLLQAFPLNAQPQLTDALHGVKASAGLLSVLALLGLLYSASAIFSTMEFAFGQIFGTPQRALPRQKLMSLVLMALTLALILLTLLANFLLAFLPAPWLTSLLVTFVSLSSLVLIFYRLVPNRTYPLLALLPASALTAFCILIISLAFPLYVHLALRANVFGASFGLFFVLAAWLYLLSLFLLFGAALNRFRLGAPTTLGLLASPRNESRSLPTPLEAIHEQIASP